MFFNRYNKDTGSKTGQLFIYQVVKFSFNQVIAAVGLYQLIQIAAFHTYDTAGIKNITITFSDF